MNDCCSGDNLQAITGYYQHIIDDNIRIVGLATMNRCVYDITEVVKFVEHAFSFLR